MMIVTWNQNNSSNSYEAEEGEYHTGQILVWRLLGSKKTPGL